MAEDIARLLRMVEQLPALGADREALAAALALLEPALGITLRACTGFWRARRDEAMWQLGDEQLLPGARVPGVPGEKRLEHYRDCLPRAARGSKRSPAL
jgi:hypothetical protein